MIRRGGREARRSAVRAACILHAIAALFAGAAIGCAVEDVVVEQKLPPASPVACGVHSDCSQGEFCAKRGCNDPRGECAPIPDVCDSTPAPVCGCDHVTYRNDCERERAGVPPTERPGACPVASPPGAP